MSRTRVLVPLTARWLTGAAVGLLIASTALAGHIPRKLDVNLIRPRMPDEGYLAYRHGNGGGEERTGWTDVRLPALLPAYSSLSTDPKRGHDYSDQMIRVLTHYANEVNKTNETTALTRAIDYKVANASLAQAGLTVRSAGHVAVPGLEIPPPGEESVVSVLFRQGRSTSPGVINAYYVGSIGGDYGISLPPDYSLKNGYNDGFAVADSARDLSNFGSSTFAHELVHYLLDENLFGTFPNRSVHSPKPNDLMHESPKDPNALEGKSPSYGSAFGVRKAGRKNGKVGGLTLLEADVTDEDGNSLSQIQAIHKKNGYISRDDNGDLFGDRADFDWVEDNPFLTLEGSPPDFHAGPDALEWEIGTVKTSDHRHKSSLDDFAHDHSDWGELSGTSYNKSFFWTVDIVSQITRYADMDVGSDGQWSAREAALDYTFPEFSKDGKTWLMGTLINVFVPGWTNRSLAENYIARWRAPFPARYVRVAAAGAGGPAGHDWNTQIDAIIASPVKVPTVPEPSSFTLAGLGCLLAASTWRRHRGKPGRPV